MKFVSPYYRNGKCFSQKVSNCSTYDSEKTKITRIICKWVFTIDFPNATAEKNFKNGISKYPLNIPAKSNKGLGTEANTNIANQPYYLINFST